MFCSDQAVASERSYKPGEPGGRQEDHMIRTCHRQAEGSHILECLAKQAIVFFVAGLDFDDVFQPVCQRLCVPRLVAVADAVSRRSIMPVAVCQCIAKAAMPWLIRFEGHLETEPSIGVHGFC